MCQTCVMLKPQHSSQCLNLLNTISNKLDSTSDVHFLEGTEARHNVTLSEFWRGGVVVFFVFLDKKLNSACGKKCEYFVNYTKNGLYLN